MPGGKRRAALKKMMKAEAFANSTAPIASTSASSASTSADVVNTEASTGADEPAAAASSSTPASPTSPTAPLSPVQAPAPAPAAAAPAPAPAAGGGMYGNGIFGGAQRGGKKGSKQRFAERQARKKQALIDMAPPSDPGWNAQLEKERQEEIQVIGHACEALNCEIFEVQPDGHCMFAAVADQLGVMGILPPQHANNPYHTRRVAAQYMRDHEADFLPFLASVDGEDMPGATDDGLMTKEQFGEYCHRVEGTAEWGGEPEIQALCRAFSVPIHVIQRGPPTVVSHGGADDAFGGATTPQKSREAGDRVVRISYHRRMYGLGEHYNSLRPAE